MKNQSMVSTDRISNDMKFVIRLPKISNAAIITTEVPDQPPQDNEAQKIQDL